MTDQLDIHGNAQPLTWDGEPMYSPSTVAEGLFDPQAFEQMPGQTAIELKVPIANGYIQARHGKWHRATIAEPCFTRDETSACGLTFRPLNVTWNGEQPATNPTHLCKRCNDGR